jgi:predicted TIM-barrel fold metal-dependent hydrolase/predicted NBD/HSP70 family sugar kinase
LCPRVQASGAHIAAVVLAPAFAEVTINDFSYPENRAIQGRSPKRMHDDAMAGGGCLRYRRDVLRTAGRVAMDDQRTLAVDIGGTGLKLALLDGSGRIVGQRVRVPTPPLPVAPDVLTAAIEGAAAKLGAFDRVSVGFPGAVRDGRILTAPNLGTELWAGFDLQTALAERWGRPVRVMNDADVQGFGAIQGEGVEMVLTLGTGAGTAIFSNGQIMPHLELAHHPVHGDQTYEDYIGKRALAKVGKKRWSKRVARIVEILRRLVNFDHLYIGGGNAKRISFELPSDVSIVPNTDGLTGGIALWRAEEAERLGDGQARSRSLKSGRVSAPGTSAPAAPRPAAHGRTATASQPRTPVAFAVPERACDCHVHVFGAAAEFPFVAGRGYTPPQASSEELAALLDALHLERVVIVQPSVYGSDNSCTLDGMRRLGARARGVAVIDATTGNAALDAMHRAGIRGVRVNLETAGETDPDAARRNLAAAVAQVAPLGWHVQVYTRLSVVAELADEIARLPVPVVFDHFGGAPSSGGVEQPGFAALLALVKAGHAYVKVSAAYRSSTAAPAYQDIAPLARALIGANPDRILWGSDWPHPHAAPPGRELGELTPFFDIDDGLALNQLPSWARGGAIRRKILVDNPARLYGF